MQNSLFTVELPLINTIEELEKVKILYSKYDPYFIVSGCIKERREKFEKLWKNFKPYANKHFIAQIKTNFHQRSWEMYVGNVLLAKKLSIKSPNEGPDFIVNENTYIECITPTKGDSDKPNSVPEIFLAKTPEEIQLQDLPEDQMILRITQAVKDKALQYEKWKNKNWFQKNASFIIAVNTGDLEHLQVYFGIPLVIKALFGLQFLQISQKGDKSFIWRAEIKKDNGVSVPVNYFANEKYKFVSGVLFSDRIVLNHPENIGDDCIFINNPFSECPVNKKFTELFKSWSAKKDNNRIKLQKNYQ